MIPQNEMNGNRFGWLSGTTSIIGSAIVGIGAPLQFYQITASQGSVDVNDPAYLFFFSLSGLVGLSAFAMTMSAVYANSHLRYGIEQRWHDFLLSRPLVKDELSRESRKLADRIEKLIQQVTELESRPIQTIEVVKIVEKPVVVKVGVPVSDEEIRAKEIVSALSIRTSPGYIYVMRREDGVFKVGRTNDTERRLAQHRSDYKAQFELICRFVVPDVFQFEHLALRLTSKFSYAEEGRNELRKMTVSELEDFVLLFHRCCIMVVNR